MLLTIDCGNTNTIFSIWDGTRFVSTWRTATDHQRTADQYFVWLSTLISSSLSRSLLEPWLGERMTSNITIMAKSPKHTFRIYITNNTI